MKHMLQPVAPAQCSMSSYIDNSKIDINLHVDTRGSPIADEVIVRAIIVAQHKANGGTLHLK